MKISGLLTLSVLLALGSAQVARAEDDTDVVNDTVDLSDGTVRVKSADGDDVVVDGVGVHMKDADGTRTHVTSDGVRTKGVTSKKNGIVIQSSDVTKTIACTHREAVSINGSDNHLTFTGECGAIAVNGADNEINVEAAKAIAVNGATNTVHYKRGLDGKKAPAIANIGAGNTVSPTK